MLILRKFNELVFQFLRIVMIKLLKLNIILCIHLLSGCHKINGTFKAFTTLILSRMLFLINSTVCLGFMFLIPDNCLAQYQDHPFKKIDKADGLSHNTVFKIFQDRKGFMWIGTMNGLNRFDGYSFTTFKKEVHSPNSLPDNWISQMAQDSSGYLWIGTHNGGLSKFDPVKKTFFNLMSRDSVPEAIQSSTIWGLMVDSEGKLWVGSGNGFDRIDPKTFKLAEFEGYDRLKEIVAGRSVNIFIEHRHYIFMGTWGQGLIVFDKTTKQVKQFLPGGGENSLSNNRVKDIVVYNDSTLFLGTQRGGLNRLNINTWKFSRPEPELLRKPFVQSIYQDGKGALWLGTRREGLIRYFPASDTYVQYKYQPSVDFGLPSDWVPDVYIDSSGLLWAATDDGVFTTTSENNGFMNFPFSMLHSSERSYEVRSLLQFEDRLWLGTVDGGVHELDLSKQTLVEEHTPFIRDMLKSQRVWVMCRDSEGHIWLGTGQGLLRYDPHKNRTEEFYNGTNKAPWLMHGNISALWFDNDELWTGTWNGGFSIYNIKTKKYEIYRASGARGALSNDFINKFYKDSKGRVWIATAGGLNYFNRKKKKFIVYRYNENNANSISGDNVEDLIEDRKGNIWLATNGGGISILNPESGNFKKITESNGLSDNAVNQVFLGERNTIWATTENGLNRIDSKEGTVEILTQQNGLLDDQFSKGRMLSDDGTFWLSTKSGIVHVAPKKIKTQSFDPPIVFTQFKRFNREEDLSKVINNGELQLSYNDYVISFSFAVLDFRSPDKNRYSYMLEGLDPNWVVLDNQNTITFQALPDGEYTLKIRGANSEGKWGNQELKLKIVVSPPFYKTISFYVAFILGLILIIYISIKWRTRRLRYIQKYLQERVTLRTKELEKEKKKVEEYSVEVVKQRDFVTRQHDLIDSQNKKLTSSIVYAKRIQTGLLPDSNFLSSYFDDSFLYFVPRDIVSGDFYWYTEKNGVLYLTVADCTGHGVPGAFMSVLGISNLAEILNAQEEIDTDVVLNRLREKIISELSKESDNIALREGMDMVLIKLDLNTLMLEFSGAYNPIYLVRSGVEIDLEPDRFLTENDYSLLEFKGDRMPIGKYEDFLERAFTKRRIQLQKGDRIYMLTDGYADQFNEVETMKYNALPLKKTILSFQDKNMEEQHRILIEEHKRWKGNGRQIDDMLVLGFQL